MAGRAHAPLPRWVLTKARMGTEKAPGWAGRGGPRFQSARKLVPSNGSSPNLLVDQFRGPGCSPEIKPTGDEDKHSVCLRTK